MKPLRALARQLLTDGEVKVVIGYEEAPRGVRPAFVTDPDDVERLIFDARCVQNLAVYLTRSRGHVARLGKPAVVIKGCDARAVAGLMRESQLEREAAVLIGVRCGGVLADPQQGGELTAHTVAGRCPGCDIREPTLADHLLGELPPAPAGVAPAAAKLTELQAMSAEQRAAFWQAHFQRCVRCYACRQVCPLCYCERCIADKTQPRWVEASAHPRGNQAWNIIRALHLAGRCAGCGECQRACPAHIPLGLLNQKMADVVKEEFNQVVGDDPSVPAAVGDFRREDAEEFIV